MNMIFKQLLAMVVILFVFSSINGIAVATDAECRGDGALKIPTWHQYLPKDANCNINTTDMGGEVVILVLFGIFDIVLFLAGFIAVIIVIWGGYKFLTSAGEPQKIASARTTIINALVGILITFVASNVVGFIAGRLS
jgi:hypothetical protein